MNNNYLLKKHVILIDLDRVINCRTGREKVFCDMANALIQRNYTVTALCCDPNIGDPGFNIDKKVRFINCYAKSRFNILSKRLFRNIRCFSLNSQTRKIKRTLLTIRKIAPLIANAIKSIPKADIYIAFQPQSVYILKQELKIKTPIVAMFHSTPDFYLKNINFKIYQPPLDQCSAIQVLMPEFIRITQKELPNVRVIYIPNVAQPFLESPNYANKKIVVLGRLAKEKRSLLLIEALVLIHSKYPDWICEWWGETCEDTKYTQLIQTEIRKRKLGKNFLIKGVTNNISNILQNASIFAFPSEREGFGLALAEALAMGLPAVGCKDCPAVNSLIQNNSNGFLTDPNPDSFASGLRKLMDSESLRRNYGQKGKEDMKQFAPETIWNTWDKLLRSLIADN